MHARIIASSKPMDLSHQFVPRAAPLLHQIVQKYGKSAQANTWVLPHVSGLMLLVLHRKDICCLDWNDTQSDHL